MTWRATLLALALPTLALTACKDPGPATHDTDVGTDAPPVDADADGYPEDVDCDDANAAVNPGATESCNGLDDDCDGQVPSVEQDVDNNGVLECDETCGAPPTATRVLTNAACEYVPAPTGTPFAATVEWSWTHAMTDPATGDFVPERRFPTFPEYGAVFQAPMVGHVSGAELPDVVAVMADRAEHNVGVLRVLAGDGSAERASTRLQSFTTPSGVHEYGPYHYAGVALGNLDDDPNLEIATMLAREDVTSVCYPGSYEVVPNGAGWDLVLEHVLDVGYACGAHAPALADLTGDGDVEVIYGRNWVDGATYQWEGGGWGGRGWWGREGGTRPEGYWNSGYHSFAYDLDGDGTTMEVVAGSTVYLAQGQDQRTDPVYCELGAYDNGVWIPALDGYPAVADLLRFPGDTPGEPEIVVTGNEQVSVFHGVPAYDPNGLARCVQIATLPNDPALDPAMTGLPSHDNCDPTARSFGGPANLSDFDGDGAVDIGVAGACWYSVYRPSATGLSRYALTQTKDWSSASTGSTVFDFNGDGASEIVFSDEQAVYVWELDTAPGLQPWERLDELLRHDDHQSFTIHEYPLVADVDGDGKAEILVSNTHIASTDPQFGLYALGALDDDWVSARQTWSQHAFFVNNANDDLSVTYAAPNYAPFDTDNLNSFRQQAPGSFGALAAADLSLRADPPCQAGCGAITVYVQVENTSPYISGGADTVVALYGESGTTRTLIESKPVGQPIGPGAVTDPVTFLVTGWDAYDRLIGVVDDPAVVGLPGGTSRECHEDNNEVTITLAGICP